MSTAGKVLVVLSVLLLGVWTILMASVSQLNTNANKRLGEIKTQIEKLKESVATTQATAEGTLVKVNEEQQAKDREMRLVLMRVSTVERQLSTTRESLSRVQIQLDNYKKALETAKVGLKARQDEGTRFIKDLADTRASVKRFQGENEVLTGELLQLRTDFEKALQVNQAEVAKQLKKNKSLLRSTSLIR